MVLERLLKLDTLYVLLILDLFLHVLVPLQQFVVLRLPELESLIQIGLQLLLQSIHLILLLLDKLCLRGDDLLGTLLHVLFTLFRFQFLASYLDFVGLLILLLLR